MKKELRIKKHKEKLHKIFKNYTDRQLLELIAYSLRLLGYWACGIGIIVWFGLMYWWNVF